MCVFSCYSEKFAEFPFLAHHLLLLKYSFLAGGIDDMGKAKVYVVTEDGMLRFYSIPFSETGGQNLIRKIFIRILKRLKKEH